MAKSSSSRGMRLRGLGICLMCCVFLLMAAVNLLWLKKAQAESREREAENKALRFQALLQQEQDKSAALEKRILEFSRASAAQAEKKQPPGSGPTSVRPTSVGLSTGRPTVQAVEPGAVAVPQVPSFIPKEVQVWDSRGRENPLIVPVIIMACDRPQYLQRTLNIIHARMTPIEGIEFQIIVSQDGTNQGVKDLMQKTFPTIKYINHINNDPIIKENPRELESYYKIARHYKWALGQVFEDPKIEWAIVMEDDLEVAPDFFYYMAAGARLLKQDGSLWTVTAWNDNSFSTLVEDPRTVYRSDFFAGLGWIMTKELWQELGPKWPKAYWDDWMREPAQRKGRACIRPEISRTTTFGRDGSSQGLFYDTHLSRMLGNKQSIDFTKEDWGSLIKANYDGPFLKQVQEAPVTSLPHPGGGTGAAKLLYNDHFEFIQIAKKLGLMEDEKAGVPRTAYLGVVTLRRGQSVLYVAPRQGKPQYKNDPV